MKNTHKNMITKNIWFTKDEMESIKAINKLNIILDEHLMTLGDILISIIRRNDLQ
jgi:hypothetical protein